MGSWTRPFVVIVVAALLGVAALVTVPSSPALAAADEPPAPNLGSCRLNLPRDVTTIVYYTYGGSVASRYRLFHEQDTHLGRQPIVVPKRDKRLFIVLVSYGPTEWDLRIDPGADVAGALVLGYRDQIVSNLPANTRLGFSIFDGGGKGLDCPTSKSGWSDDMKALSAMLNAEFSHYPDEHYNSGYEDCSYFLCQRSGKVADKPKPSFWARMFGGAKAEEPAPKTDSVIRTSARLIVR
ncbi:hypothetical protein [Bradyrhizobium acaciae]|uniref:hypothetical protein n=1 Tax=Bradyrhizobium acaciae TaxID=2683706 RepID=UPI001E4A7001|nr:hypothetical protein [Bradyrhizobium acaciae]MCC8982997.1 hypothetical protein [Bradyrhizobium acaciae]